MICILSFAVLAGIFSPAIIIAAFKAVIRIWPHATGMWFRQNNSMISKSKFMAGVQWLKRLYLIVHEPQLAAPPDGSSEAIIEQGREVGILARQLFPGGIEVNGSGGLEAAIRVTRELVATLKSLRSLRVPLSIRAHSGVHLASVWLAHINRKYVLAEGTVDPSQFFLFRNLTRRGQNLQPTLLSDYKKPENIIGE
jgi:hypothetical protein